MNSVILSGNLTRDPEVRHTQNGKAYTRMGIAVNRSFSKDAVDFFNLLAWDKTAEFCGKYLKKGSRVFVEGRLQTSKYKDKDGTERTAVDITVDNIEFGDSKRQDSGEQKSQPRQETKRKQRDDFDGEPLDPDDMPF